MVVLLRDGAEVACWPMERAGRHGLALVDELARLKLAVRRLGCSIRLRDTCPRLAELLELVGLDEILAEIPALARREVVRETEGGEQRGIEEVVVPDDPVA